MWQPQPELARQLLDLLTAISEAKDNETHKRLYQVSWIVLCAHKLHVWGEFWFCSCRIVLEFRSLSERKSTLSLRIIYASFYVVKIKSEMI